MQRRLPPYGAPGGFLPSHKHLAKHFSEQLACPDMSFETLWNTQLDMPKPLGFKYARGQDGGAYIIESNPKLGNIDPRVQASSLRADLSRLQSLGCPYCAVGAHARCTRMLVAQCSGNSTALFGNHHVPRSITRQPGHSVSTHVCDSCSAL